MYTEINNLKQRCISVHRPAVCTSSIIYTS